MRTRRSIYSLRHYFFVATIIAIVCMLYHRSLSTLAKNFFSRTAFTTSPSAMANKPVIIVGSGLAGLSAAHEALKAGARVHMLDRAPKPGGNSIKASSGINGAGTKFQRDRGIAKDESFYDDTVRSAGALFQAGPKWLDRQALVETLTARSADAVEWLVNDIGVDLSVVAQLGGHSLARTHRGAGSLPPGAAIVQGMLKKLNENTEYTLTNAANVESLLLDDDDGAAVKGVRYTVDGNANDLEGPVVFAAGGFAGDAHHMLARYRPDLAGMPSTNEARPGPQPILERAGAEFVDMQSVQVHPTGFVDPKDPGSGYKFLAAEALRGEGGILLDNKGERFVNEMERRDVVSAAVMALPGADVGPTRQWDVTLLLDPGACEATASHLSFYLWKGLMRKTKVRDLPPAVIASVDRYAEAVTGGEDAALGRRTFGYWKLPAGEANRDQEVCVGTVTPVVHFTMGGAAFNTKTQVLGRKGDGLVPIKGLWAAGETTGGIHGANRLGGSSLLECAVYGRVAGQEAAKSLTGV